MTRSRRRRRVRRVLRRAGSGRRRFEVPQPAPPLHARAGAGRGADLLGRLRLRATRRLRGRRHVRRVAVLASADRGRRARVSPVGARTPDPAAARDPGHAPEAVDVPRHAEGGLHGSRCSLGAAARRTARAARAGGVQGQESESPCEGEEQHVLRLPRPAPARDLGAAQGSPARGRSAPCASRSSCCAACRCIRSSIRKRGLVFAICGVVLHMVYYLTAAVSVVWGAFLAVVVGEPRPDASVEAFSELESGVVAARAPQPEQASSPKASAAKQ